MRLVCVCAALMIAVVCAANLPGIPTAPASTGEAKLRLGRGATDGDKEKGDFLSAVATAANAAKLVAQYGCPIARLAYAQCNQERNQGGYDQKLIQATWEHVTQDVDQSTAATVSKAIRDYGCPAVGLVSKLCVLA